MCRLSDTLPRPRSCGCASSRVRCRHRRRLRTLCRAHLRARSRVAGGEGRSAPITRCRVWSHRRGGGSRRSGRRRRIHRRRRLLCSSGWVGRRSRMDVRAAAAKEALSPRAPTLVRGLRIGPLSRRLRALCTCRPSARSMRITTKALPRHWLAWRRQQRRTAAALRTLEASLALSLALHRRVHHRQRGCTRRCRPARCPRTRCRSTRA